MSKQKTRIVSDRVAVKCPECRHWTTDASDVAVEMPDGHEHYLCTPCAHECYPLESQLEDTADRLLASY